MFRFELYTIKWTPPPAGFYKMNNDVGFNNIDDTTNWEMCCRGNLGAFFSSFFLIERGSLSCSLWKERLWGCYKLSNGSLILV